MEHLEFQAELSMLIELTNPLAQAILCLESPHGFVSNVVVFFAAALVMYRKAIPRLAASKMLDIPSKAITQILLKRWNKLINSKRGHDVYVVATLLHLGKMDVLPLIHSIKLLPGLLASDMIKKPSPSLLSTTDQTSKPARLMIDLVYRRGWEYLKQLLQACRDSALFPELNILSRAQLISSLAANWNNYSQGCWPYGTFVSSGMTPLEWWKQNAQNKSTQPLAVSQTQSSVLFSNLDLICFSFLQSTSSQLRPTQWRMRGLLRL